MLIKKLYLENYGLYAGNVEFDLAPKAKGHNPLKPIVLFGGNNGTGKTTLLDAVRLAFYGRASLGNRVSKKEYSKFLLDQIHKNDSEIDPSKSAKLGIEFEHVFLGNTDTYYVERSWENSNQSPEESLKIVRNNIEIDNVTEEYWRGFIEEVIPERLSQLFFFDGEKIKAIADDQTSGNTLAESIQIMLGLDIIDRLKADLKTHQSREVKSISEAFDRKKTEQIENIIEIARSQIIPLDVQREVLINEINSLNKSITDLELKLDQEGASFSFQRNSEKSQQEILNSRYDYLKKHIIDECEGSFPFSLCQTFTEKVATQIQNEKSFRSHKSISSAIKKVESDISNLFSKNRINSDTKLKEEIEGIFTKQYDELKVPVDFEQILELSNSDEQLILQWIHEANEQSPNNIKRYGLEITDVRERLQKIEQVLGQAPSEENLKPYFDEIISVNKNIGSKEQEIKHIDKEISEKNNFIAQLLQDKRKLEKKYESEESVRNRLNLNKKVQQALNDYSNQLTEKKIFELRFKVAEFFNSLSRKEDIIQHVEIDPKTFRVTLISHSGIVISKDKLSAGEKQIFAIAFLWGLAATAQRPLPVIIDTPLGRLDSEHRDNLINRYFPNAAHQVILLSTDTEFDKSLYKKLFPYISHCYHLSYDNNKRRTVPQLGYFWGNDE